MTKTQPTIRQKIPLRISGGIPVYAATFDNLSDSKDHIAFIFERGTVKASPLLRVHSSCVTGDIFGSQRCDCGEQLHDSIARLDREGGVLVYLFQEGRGIGLKAKFDAYALQINEGLDTYEANLALGHSEDERNYKPAAEILKVLGLAAITLITNNPDKAEQLKANGIAVTASQPTKTTIYQDNHAYLLAKRAHGHHLNLE